MTKISAASLVPAASGMMQMPTGEVGDLAISVDQIRTYVLLSAGTVTSVGLTVGSAGTDVSVTGSPITSTGSFTLDIPTASATNRGVLSTTDWSTFNNKQATGLSWLLASGGTLTGTNTITSNARNQFNFSGTWTSTVTGDYHVNWGGSLTALSGGANTINYMTITPTMTANNNGQVLNGLVIDPSYSVGAFTGTQRNHLQLGNSTVGTTFQQSPDNASRGLNIESKNTWQSYAFRFSTGSQNTSSGNLNGILLTGTFGNISSGTGAYAQLNINYSLNQSGGTGILRGIYYNPAITAVINHTAIQTTSGRLAFNMTGNPTSQVQFRAAGTSTNSHILVEDSSQNQMLNILDNGDIRIGSTTDYTRIRQPLGGNTKGLEFESQPSHLTYAFRFNIAGVSGSFANGNFDGMRTGSTVNANGATTGTYNELLITTDFDVTSASSTQTLRHIKIDSNINCTAGTSTVRAFDYDPTVASSTGLSHYGITIRPTGVFNGFGVATPVALVQIAAGTTAYAPLKLTSGTNLTTAQAGAFEYNGTNLFFTRSGTTREGVLTQSAVTTEALVSDTSVTINIGGVTYKLLARA